jgi:hypothetical protein
MAVSFYKMQLKNRESGKILDRLFLPLGAKVGNKNPYKGKGRKKVVNPYVIETYIKTESNGRKFCHFQP